jgi:hypothetical protein
LNAIALRVMRARSSGVCPSDVSWKLPMLAVASKIMVGLDAVAETR